MPRSKHLVAMLALLAAAQPALGGGIPSGHSWGPGEMAASPDGRYTLTMQSDGNLVWLDGRTPIWSSGSHGTALAVCRMQADGNLVVYGVRKGGYGPVWEAGTSGHPGARLVCQSDGNLVVYSGATALWSSGTVAGANGMAAGVPEVAKAGGAAAVGAALGWGGMTLLGAKGVGLIGAGAGMGAPAGPAGVAAGAVLGLAAYGVYRVCGD